MCLGTVKSMSKSLGIQCIDGVIYFWFTNKTWYRRDYSSHILNLCKYQVSKFVVNSIFSPTPSLSSNLPQHRWHGFLSSRTGTQISHTMISVAINAICAGRVTNCPRTDRSSLMDMMVVVVVVVVVMMMMMLMMMMMWWWWWWWCWWWWWWWWWSSSSSSSSTSSSSTSS